MFLSFHFISIIPTQRRPYTSKGFFISSRAFCRYPICWGFIRKWILAHHAARRRAAPCRRCAAHHLVARRPVALLTFTVVVLLIAVVVPPVPVLPLAVMPPITIVECVVCRVSKTYLYHKKEILGTQLLQTARRRQQTTTANGWQQETLIFYLDEVCALFILLAMVQILHTD